MAEARRAAEGVPGPPRLPPDGDRDDPGPHELAVRPRWLGDPDPSRGRLRRYRRFTRRPPTVLSFFTVRQTVTVADLAAVPDAETPREDGIVPVVALRGAGGYFLEIQPAVLCGAPATLPVVTSLAQVHQRRHSLVVSLPSTH